MQEREIIHISFKPQQRLYKVVSTDVCSFYTQNSWGLKRKVAVGGKAGPFWFAFCLSEGLQRAFEVLCLVPSQLCLPVCALVEGRAGFWATPPTPHSSNARQKEGLQTSSTLGLPHQLEKLCITLSDSPLQEAGLRVKPILQMLQY